ncbi:hypothetical protein [uncultured Methanoregula sp.]|uniref:hypothetical protein n=1 Tax=uncultured Methanoregula sp. TaxID=1005933 RepID=UPI002AAACFD3|nr:hypothetical protein [uncultured Methanoregula sp.]
MRKYPGIPELLEMYMQEQGTDERWVTVQELRDRFGLTRYQCNTVSGFLRRLEYGPFGQCPYIVVRIETPRNTCLSDPPKCRYLVKRRNMIPAGLAGIHHSGVQARRKAGSSESG